MEIELDVDATVARILNPYREPAPHHPLTDVLMRMMAYEEKAKGKRVDPREGKARKTRK